MHIKESMRKNNLAKKFYFCSVLSVLGTETYNTKLLLLIIWKVAIFVYSHFYKVWILKGYHEAKKIKLSEILTK